MDLDLVRTRGWAWYLALVVFATQYYVVSAYGATANDTLYVAIGVSALAAGVAGIALNRPARWWAWTLVVAAIGMYLTADAVLAQLEEDNVIVPFPSLADWLYLGVYPVLAVAFVAIRRALAPGGDRRATLDSIAVAIGALGVLTPLYLMAVWNSPFLSGGDRWVAVAYPVFDALLLGVGARLVFAAGRRFNALSLLGASTIVLVVGNAVWNAQVLGDGFEPGGVASVGWLAFTSLLGGAAMHPSVRFAGTSARAAHQPLTLIGRLVAPVAAVSIVLAQLRWGDDDSRTLAVACLVAVVALGIVRRGVDRPSGGPAVEPSSDGAEAAADASTVDA